MNTKYMVTITDKTGTIIWSHGIENGQRAGITSTDYRKDGTLVKILGSLKLAESQVMSEMGLTVPFNID